MIYYREELKLCLIITRQLLTFKSIVKMRILNVNVEVLNFLTRRKFGSKEQKITLRELKIIKLSKKVMVQKIGTLRLYNKG